MPPLLVSIEEASQQFFGGNCLKLKHSLLFYYAQILKPLNEVMTVIYTNTSEEGTGANLSATSPTFSTKLF